MADLTTEAVSSVAAAAVGLTTAILGLEPQVLLFAAMGGFVGMAIPAKLGLPKAVIAFLCVMCLAGAAGTWFAQAMQSTPAARNLVAAGVAFAFQPLTAILVQRLSSVVDAALKRMGVS